MKYLLNSAVLATGAYGVYRYSPATCGQLQSFCTDGVEPVSRIGYEETATMIQKWTGYRPTISRESSVMLPGDEAMIVRLNSRVENPRTKGAPIDDDSRWEIAHLLRVE